MSERAWFFGFREDRRVGHKMVRAGKYFKRVRLLKYGHRAIKQNPAEKRSCALTRTSTTRHPRH